MTEDEKTSPEPEPAPKGTTFKGKEKKEKSRPLTKIVCRRLPPTMTEESFLEQVSPIPEHDYFYFAKPDYSLTPDLFSRAYINFVNVEDIFLFRDKFDEYIFLDDKGNEYPAIVEYAPFQRLPKKRRKKDPKSGTIESDPTFLEFLESLKETDSDSREPKMEYSYQITEEKKETTTPLLEYLAARRREEKRRKEERQRRRTRNRNSKDDDIYEDDVKKIKPRDNDKSREIERSSGKKKDEDFVNKSESMDSKESKYPVKGGKSYRDQRKSSDDQRKKGDHERKDYNKNKDTDYNEEKGNRRERRERQRESPKDKVKEVKKYSDSRKDKIKSIEKKAEKLPSFRQIDENELDETSSPTKENKTLLKSSSITSTSENTPESTKNIPKAALVSSNIKPFTQLPQYNVEDLTKVIEELDKSVNKMKLISQSTETTNIDMSVTTETEIDENKINKKIIIENKGKSKVTGEPITPVKETKSESLTQKDKENIRGKTSDTILSTPDKEVPKGKIDTETKKSEDSPHQRRSSLESSEIKSTTDETPLRRHKSLDDKSEDTNDYSMKDNDKNKSNDQKKERRIRNKDRPSIVIYQPGMGKFSKQRLERVKDAPSGTYKSLDPVAQSGSKTNAENTDKSSES